MIFNLALLLGGFPSDSVASREIERVNTTLTNTITFRAGHQR